MVQRHARRRDRDQRRALRHLGCPVLLVTGDEVACAESHDLLVNGLTTVAVKRGLGSFSARMIPPVRARQLIEEGATRALSNLTSVAPYDPGKPCEIRVEIDDRTVVSRADTWWDAWKQFYF